MLNGYSLWIIEAVTETLSAASKPIAPEKTASETATFEMKVFAESKVTDRYQTTLPASVRKALGITKQDKVAYGIGSDGKVYLTRLEPEGSDPVLAKFAAFLAKDIAQNPKNVRPISPDLVDKSRALIEGMDSDLNAPLEEDD